MKFRIHAIAGGAWALTWPGGRIVWAYATWAEALAVLNVELVHARQRQTDHY
jgi:hypothetical protein